eukprot:3192097-Prorocentrum_lima.AAC.1
MAPVGEMQIEHRGWPEGTMWAVEWNGKNEFTFAFLERTTNCLRTTVVSNCSHPNILLNL